MYLRKEKAREGEENNKKEKEDDLNTWFFAWIFGKVLTDDGRIGQQ